ncbi:uncharacterized protein LOC117190578 [Drosophila miranda]|uniref:uncharacterized protein LOC117190578 n=1 Tax=Drosophila miranda TaxID=7229 RepID=UPI00143F1F73|nr:uncharacterized protein LOC117190578 [Drosophila miranda]
MAAVCLKWRVVIVMVWWQRHQKRPSFPPIWQEIVSVGGEAAVGGAALSVYWQWLSLNRRLGTSIGAARTHAFACAGDLGPPHLAQTLQIVEWIVVGPFVVILVVNCFTVHIGFGVRYGCGVMVRICSWSW